MCVGREMTVAAARVDLATHDSSLRQSGSRCGSKYSRSMRLGQCCLRRGMVARLHGSHSPVADRRTLMTKSGTGKVERRERRETRERVGSASCAVAAAAPRDLRIAARILTARVESDSSAVAVARRSSDQSPLSPSLSLSLSSNADECAAPSLLCSSPAAAAAAAAAAAPFASRAHFIPFARTLARMLLSLLPFGARLGSRLPLRWLLLATSRVSRAARAAVTGQGIRGFTRL